MPARVTGCPPDRPMISPGPEEPADPFRSGYFTHFMKTRHSFLIAIISLATLGLLPCGRAQEKPAPTPSFEGETIDQWQGRPRHVFQVAGHKAWVVEPVTPLPGRPWTWCTEFPDAFTARTGVPQLLASGVYHAHISDFNRLGCDDQLKLMDEFHRTMVAKGFAPKVALIGLSRGGFMAYRWAQRNPENIACIYGDAPVCDLKSWPAGFGTGKGSKGDWKHAKELYGWKTDEEARAFAENALDEKPLSRLAAAKVPLLHVVGDADDLVPVAENTAILAERYRKLGGEITVIPHAAGHHPHGLDDPSPVVDFILKNVKPADGSR